MMDLVNDQYLSNDKYRDKETKLRCKLSKEIKYFEPGMNKYLKKILDLRRLSLEREGLLP